MRAVLVLLAVLAVPAALATRPVFAAEEPQARALEAPSPAPAPRAVRTPRVPRAPSAPRAAESAPDQDRPAPEADAMPPVPPEARDGMFEMLDPSTRVVPRGWFGFGFQCGNCTANRSRVDSAAVWRFGDWPKVYSVDLGSPAAQAGLRRGDVITAIDGFSLLTPEGGRRFGAILPGQAVRWSLLREGAPRVVIAHAVERPERRERVALTELRGELSRLNDLSDLGELRRELANLNQRIDRIKVENIVRATSEADMRRVRVMALPVRRLRYAGVIGGTEVEVRGPGSVIISKSDLRDELVINTGEAVVVIRVSASLPKKAGDDRK